jgi:hypothetical protein
VLTGDPAVGVESIVEQGHKFGPSRTSFHSIAPIR